MKKVIWIQKTEAAINQNDGNCKLPHVYDDIILPGRHCH